MTKVSIITAAFNVENYIQRTFASICAQVEDDWEWLVCDDCSTDSTWQALQSIAQVDSRVKLYRTDHNSGAAQARNVVLSHAKAEYVAFLDGDDVWRPNKLTSQLEFMERNSLNFCFTAYELIDGNDRKLGKVVDLGHSRFAFNYGDMLKKAATLGCSTVILRRTAFSEIKMPDYRTGQDYGLWLKLLKQGGYAVLLPEVLSSYRILPGSISRNKFKKAKRQWQIYRELERLPLGIAAWCFLHYAYRAVKRR